MTQLDLHPFVARNLRSTQHRVLAVLAVLATLAYAGVATWLAVTTYAEGLAAGPEDDTSLYGVGYVVAGVCGVVALGCAVGGALGWWLARRYPDLGAAVLATAVALGLAPLALFG